MCFSILCASLIEESERKTEEPFKGHKRSQKESEGTIIQKSPNAEISVQRLLRPILRQDWRLGFRQKLYVGKTVIILKRENDEESRFEILRSAQDDAI